MSEIAMIEDELSNQINMGWREIAGPFIIERRREQWQQSVILWVEN